jgi:Ca2+-binding EF-hand superfamily protein
MPRRQTTMKRSASGFDVHGRRNEDNAVILMRQHQMMFQEADINRDGRLDFSEFEASIPDKVKKMHTAAEMREWFDMLDHDKNGEVSRDEHLRWSLNAAALASGAGLKDVFARYDGDGSGTLSLMEFCRAANDFGAGEHAEQLFSTLPGSSAGRVNYCDIVALVQSAQGLGQLDPKWSSKMRTFLTAMAWNSTVDHNEVDTSSWHFSASDANGVRTALRELLHTHGVRLSSIFEAIDDNDDNVVSRGEFVRALADRLGFRGERSLLARVFTNEIDDDRSGSVSFDEVLAWIDGRHTSKGMRLAAVRELSLPVELCGPEGADGSWDVGRLREELLKALDRVQARSTDLAEELGSRSGSSGNGLRIRKRDLLRRLKVMVANEPLWTLKVRDSVVEMFGSIDTDGNGHITSDDIARWLQEGGRRPPPVAQLEGGVGQAKSSVPSESYKSPAGCRPRTAAGLRTLKPAQVPGPLASSVVARAQTPEGPKCASSPEIVARATSAASRTAASLADSPPPRVPKAPPPPAARATGGWDDSQPASLPLFRPERPTWSSSSSRPASAAPRMGSSTAGYRQLHRSSPAPPPPPPPGHQQINGPGASSHLWRNATACYTTARGTDVVELGRSRGSRSGRGRGDGGVGVGAGGSAGPRRGIRLVAYGRSSRVGGTAHQHPSNHLSSLITRPPVHSRGMHLAPSSTSPSLLGSHQANQYHAPPSASSAHGLDVTVGPLGVVNDDRPWWQSLPPHGPIRPPPVSFSRR